MRTTTFSYNNGESQFTVTSQETLGIGVEHICDAIRDMFYKRFSESAEKNELSHSTVLADLIAYDFSELASRLGEPCDTSLTTAELCVDRLVEDRVDEMPYDMQARLLNALYCGKLAVVSDSWDDDGIESVTFEKEYFGGQLYRYTVDVADLPAKTIESISEHMPVVCGAIHRFNESMAKQLDSMYQYPNTIDDFRQYLDTKCLEWVNSLPLDTLESLYVAVNYETSVIARNEWKELW